MSKRITFTDDELSILLPIIEQADAIDDPTDDFAVEYDKQLKALKVKMGVRI